MHDIEAKLKPICDIKEQLVDICKAELTSKGAAQIDGKELGEAIDMIKDLAEAEKCCWEAHYYKTVVEAMEEPQRIESDIMRLGYNMGRMSGGESRGRSDSSSGSSSGNNGSSGSSGFRTDNWPGSSDYSSWSSRPGTFHDAGWATQMSDIQEDRTPRHGAAYEEWRKARRHYTETGKQSDKEEMSAAASEHVASTISTMRDIWGSADPEQRKRMKDDLQNLLNEMK